MPSPLLQLGLGALVDNPAIVEFAARAGEKVLSILKAHFIFSAHEITNAYQESFGKALEAISDELAQKRALVSSKLRKDFTAQFTNSIAKNAGVQSFSFVNQLKDFANHKDELFKFAPITDADLAALFNYQSTVALTDLLLEQMQHIAKVDDELAKFFRHDDLLGKAVLFFLREKFRTDDRFEKTVATLQQETLLFNQQRMMAWMEHRQLSTQIKARDEFTHHDTVTRQRLQKSVNHLKYLRNNLPGYHQLSLMVGSAMSSTGDLAQAERLFTQTIENTEDNLEKALASFNRFQVRLRRKAYEEALPDLQAAIAIDPDQYALHDIQTYPIERLLGAGGMGCVFLCRNNNPTIKKEWVAVKCFWETLKESPQDVFEEAKAMREIAGDYVPEPLTCAYFKTDKAFFVTEYIEGAIDGEAWLEKYGSMDLAMGLQVGLQIAKGLQIAHDAGIYHLDLKPANILLCPRPKSEGAKDWQVKIIDFGLAKITTPLEQYAAPIQKRSAHSQLAQQVFGTFDYSPPEQWENTEYRQVTEKNDVFALGKTLYRFFTGKRPHQNFRQKHLPDVGLHELLEDCVEIDPAERPNIATVLKRLTALLPKTAEKLVEEISEVVETVEKPMSLEIAEKPIEKISEVIKIVVKSLDTSETVKSASSLIPVFQRPFHHSKFHLIAYSPDSSYFATASEEGVMCLYSSADYRLLRYLVIKHKRITSIAIAPDGRYLAVGSEDATVQLWDVHIRELLHTFAGHKGRVLSVAFAPNGKLLASGSADNTVRLWNLHDGKLLHTLTGHGNEILSVTFAPDNWRLASGSADKTARLWDAEAGELSHTLKVGHYEVLSIAFSSDGKNLVTVDKNKKVQFWNAYAGDCLYSGSFKRKNASDWIEVVAFTLDNKYLAFCHEDIVELWDVHNKKISRALKIHKDKALSVAFAPDNKRLVSVSSDKTLQIWDVYDGKCLHTTKPDHSVCSIAFVPDGQYLASGNSDKTVRFWDVNTSKPLHTFTGHKDQVFSVAFSPDSQRLASGSGDNTVQVWDINTKKLLHTLAGHEGKVNSLAFSPDSRRIIASGSGTVRIWYVQVGELLHTIKHDGYVYSVAFTPNGKSLASGSSNKVQLWNAYAANLLNTVKGNYDAILSLTFALNSKYLASGSKDKMVRIWSIDIKRCLRTFEGHEDSVYSVAFSPDGQHLASASLNEVRLWDVNSGECLAVLQAVGEIYTVAFAPNGRYLVAAGSEGCIWFWDAQTYQLLLTRYVLEGEAYLDILPEGCFDANEVGMKYLCYTETDSLTSYRAEEVKEQFYQPEAVQAVLKEYN